jgi:putative transposase
MGPAMPLLFTLTVCGLRSLAGSRQGLVLDNRALRHQLATLAHRGRRPRLLPNDRPFWVALRTVWTDWSRALVIVEPATVVAWQRRAYSAYWRRLSRQPGRPRTDAQLRDLTHRMVAENRWGAPRIHGELVKLGFSVSERTVSRYVRMSRPRRPPGVSWKTFLDNHREVLAAMDFFTVPTLSFRPLYALLVIADETLTIINIAFMVDRARTSFRTRLWDRALRGRYPSTVW